MYFNSTSKNSDGVLYKEVLIFYHIILFILILAFSLRRGNLIFTRICGYGSMDGCRFCLAEMILVTSAPVTQYCGIHLVVHGSLIVLVLAAKYLLPTIIFCCLYGRKCIILFPTVSVSTYERLIPLIIPQCKNVVFTIFFSLRARVLQCVCGSVKTVEKIHDQFRRAYFVVYYAPAPTGRGTKR